MGELSMLPRERPRLSQRLRLMLMLSTPPMDTPDSLTPDTLATPDTLTTTLPTTMLPTAPTTTDWDMLLMPPLPLSPPLLPLWPTTTPLPLQLPPGTPRSTTPPPSAPLDSPTLPSPPLPEDMLVLADMSPTLPELSMLPKLKFSPSRQDLNQEPIFLFQ